MANEEHVALLRQGVKYWNQWREKNPEIVPNLRDADLNGLNLSGADLSRANLRSADLTGADLVGTNLREANLLGANLYGIDLSQAVLIKADLFGATLVDAVVCFADFSNANLKSSNLRRADFTHADLSGANFINADLGYANLTGVNLSGANLYGVQALYANFNAAILTGVYIEDWNINPGTDLQDVVCEYIFVKYSDEEYQFTERRPHDPTQTFAPGEFAALVQKSLETVDLIFVDGIDWKAFFQSFQQLQEKYRADNLGIQAIEKKSDGAFVIRLEVSPDANKAAIEQDSKSFYEAQLKALEAQYQEMLRLQGDSLEDARRTIEYERQEKATLMGIVTTLANNQGPRNDFRGARFGGGVAIDSGIQTGGTLNDFSDEQGGD